MYSGFYGTALAGEVFVSVAPGTDTLRAAIAALPAAPSYVTHLILSAGTYNEIQLTPKSNISIEGAGVGVTIIDTDGTRVDIDPTSGQRYVDMAESAKHGIDGDAGFSVRNLTWNGNDIKYVIHDDHSRGDSLIYAENVAFVMDDTYCVGVGASNGADSEYRGCSFTSTTVDHGFFWHSVLSQTDDASLILRDCTFAGVGTLTLLELGPSVTNTVDVIDCTTDQVGAGQGIYINAASSGLAYSIEITEDGGSMPVFSYNATTRPDAESHYTLVP